MSKEYIDRQIAVKGLRMARDTDGADFVSLIPTADAVPWEWLERYANGMRMNFSSDFVAEARKLYEKEIH